jgi:acyl carrier protein
VSDVIERTRAWVCESYLYMRPDWPLGDETPLLGSGVIDSVGVIELVSFLQDAFEFTIADEEIVERNLGTLATIGRFVHERCAQDRGLVRPPTVVTARQ